MTKKYQNGKNSNVTVCQKRTKIAQLSYWYRSLTWRGKDGMCHGGSCILRDWGEEAELWDSFTSALVGQMSDTCVETSAASLLILCLKSGHFWFSASYYHAFPVGRWWLHPSHVLSLDNINGQADEGRHTDPTFGEENTLEIDFEVGDTFPVLKSHNSSKMRRPILVISCSQP